MGYLIAAIAVLGLSIPLVRLLSLPSSGILPEGASGSNLWAAGSSIAEVPPLVSVVGQGAVVLENFADTVVSSLRSVWSPPDAAHAYLDTIGAASEKNNLPPGLLARVLWQESRFRPEIISGAVRSNAGAIGIAQFMPATAQDEGVNPLDAESAIPGAARYLAKLYRSTGDWPLALAAYNWGLGNVRKYLAANAKSPGSRKLPAETFAYLSIARDVGIETNLV